MLPEKHKKLADFIWEIADKIRGPYRPPQYRRVMLPMIVLRRLDCVLEDGKDFVLEEYERLKVSGLSDVMARKSLGDATKGDRKQPLFNVSKFTFRRLLGDPNQLATNLEVFIRGFSDNVQDIFSKFEFEKEIAKLNESNRLFEVVKAFADVNLHPDEADNLQMGYLFEDLVRRFNEQANEEAGDHFTPREVIRLMAHLVYTYDEHIYVANKVRTIYDPTCGTGGMLSVSEEYIRSHNKDAILELFGQEYNAEAYAICCSDMLIKDEPVDNIVYGDTLGDGKTSDGHPNERFHYMMANPPFGVKWEPQKNNVEFEHKNAGFDGRFGPGLPPIDDGALLFLLNMISKMHPSPEEDKDSEGSKIAVVFSGSPLFSGDAGSGSSNIRRWIIEKDLLDAVVALPDQLFYNTGIHTYIWLLTNRKPPERKGKVQLIDGTRHFQKMKKSLNNKRNELSDAHIDDITRLYGDFQDGATAVVKIEDREQTRVCSRIFDRREFGYLKLTIDRPLRLNFQTTPDRIAKLKAHSTYLGLAISRKRKAEASIVAEEEAAGRDLQNKIMDAVSSLDSTVLYKNRDRFWADLLKALKKRKVAAEPPIKKLLLDALSERDPTADICTSSGGVPEPDPDLRDTESVALPPEIELPLPITYDKKPDNSDLVALVRSYCDNHFEREIKPHWPDAWIDYGKTKIGYEIPITRHFYIYEPPRPLESIEADIERIEEEIFNLLKKVVG